MNALSRKKRVQSAPKLNDPTLNPGIMNTNHNVNAISDYYCRKHGPHFMVQNEDTSPLCTMCGSLNLERKCTDMKCNLCTKCSTCSELATIEAETPTQAEINSAPHLSSYQVQDIPENLF